MTRLSQDDWLRHGRGHGWIFCRQYIYPYMIALKLIKPSHYEAFLRADLQECESFAEFITTALPNRIKIFFPLDDNEGTRNQKKDLVIRIQNVLKALTAILGIAAPI